MGRALRLTEVSVRSAGIVGDETTLSGWVEGDPAAVLRAAERARAQARDPLAESLTPVVVVPCGLHRLPVETGYYRVVDVDMRFDAAVNADGDAEIGLTLQRVQGYAAPLFESVVVGSKRAFSAAGVTPLAWHAIPSAADGYETGILTPTTTTVQTDSGPVQVFTDETNHLFNSRPQWWLEPEDWYVGAAELHVDGQLVVGRQTPNQPLGWRVGNGIIRAFSDIVGRVVIEWFNPSNSAWVRPSIGYGPGTWQIGRTLAVANEHILLGAPHTLTVLRNDPAAVTIRCSYDAQAIVAGSRFVVNVDYSLRRGSSVLEVTLDTRGDYKWGFRAPVSWAGTQAHDSHTDGAGIICGTDGYARYDISNGSIWFGRPDMSGPLQRIQWGWGFLRGLTQEHVARRYAAAQAERVTVVAR